MTVEWWGQPSCLVGPCVYCHYHGRLTVMLWELLYCLFVQTCECFDVQKTKKRKMNVMLVAMFLPLLLLLASITPVTSRLNSITVIPYRGLRKTKNGEVRCAMDTANETISSSSQQQCSLRCAKDATCTGFNIKNQLTFDVYNYKPKFVALVVACMFFEVGYISELTLYLVTRRLSSKY